jgi:DNA/RNA-binding domain of Phe-tRNA-synthetase-like protein
MFNMEASSAAVSSFEILARIVLSGGRLPAGNTMVETAVLMSLKHFLPVTVLDYSFTSGRLIVKTVDNIADKDKVNGAVQNLADGGNLTVCDLEKPICFRYAALAFDDMQISPGATKIFLIVFGAPGISRTDVEVCLQDSIKLVKRVSGGSVLSQHLVE